MTGDLNTPKHIGIIMDGNGRWAVNRGKPRTAGHKEGLEAAKRIIKAACKAGISFVTLYTFSTENWKRTEDEVGFLMGLIKNHLRKEYEFYKENGIKVLHCGDISKLPVDVQEEIRLAEKDTENFSAMTVILALNYGGRNEIIRAVKKIPPEMLNALNEEEFSSYMDNTVPFPDLIIRTGGEKRLSNFLLWQSAYSEFYFSDKLWPDWQEEDLIEALKDFGSRNRRYGGIS